MNDYIHDAIELVSGWDLDPEEFAQAVNDQARLMAGTCLEDSSPAVLPSAYLALQF